ncbi:MAG: helix-turn-helix domain-containing protein [Rhizomicrobium sp.]
MMTQAEFTQYLDRLGLSVEKAAKLLDVSPRTVRRWREGEELRGPVETAVRAWIFLHDRHLPWMPDSASVIENDREQIDLHRANAIDLAALHKRVEDRGGPKLTWNVDLSKGKATLGPVQVSFYRLRNGGFSLANYRRSDAAPDAHRDREIIEDAAYSIGQAIKKRDPAFGPVVVVSHDGSAKGRTAKQQQQTFATNRDAIRSVCQSLGQPQFHEPFIMTESPADPLWETRELLRECRRRTDGPAALTALADYARRNSAAFVRSGPAMLSPADTAKRQKHIEAIATQIEELARKTREGFVDYMDFEPLLRDLHASGFFPENGLVSAAAQALV